MIFFEYVWIFNDFQWIFNNFHWFLIYFYWFAMDFQWFSMIFNRFFMISIDFHWFSVDFQWFPLIFYDIQWNFNDFPWIFNDFQWISIDFLIFVSFTRPKLLFSNIKCGVRRVKGEGNTCIYMYLSLHELVGILARVCKTACVCSFAFFCSHCSLLCCPLVGFFSALCLCRLI